MNAASRSSAPLPPAVQHKNLSHDLIAAMASAPWAVLSLPASFIISALLTQYYGIQPGMYGLIASLPAWCNALQIGLVPLLARYMDARDMTLSMSWLNAGLWVLLAAMLSYLPTDNATDAGHIFLIFFALTSFSSSFVGVGWTSWIQQWVPENIRGDHFGRRNRRTGIITVSFLVLSMFTLDKFEGSVWAYQSLIIVCAIGRLFSLLWLHPIVTPVSNEPSKFGASDWLYQLRDLRHHPGFLRMVVINAWFGFWTGLVAPFMPVYAYNHLAVTPGHFAFLSILASLTAAAFMPVWGRVLDKNGCIPVMVAGVFFWRLVDFGWCFVTPETNWVLYPMWFSGGVFSAAFLLGQFNLILRLMPTHARTAAVSLNLSVMSLAAGIAPVLGGIILQNNLREDDLLYRIGIGAMCIASILSIPLLRSIKEPEKTNPKGVLGAMRTARQILMLQGMAFAAATNTIARKRLSPVRSSTPDAKRRQVIAKSRKKKGIANKGDLPTEQNTATDNSPPQSGGEPPSIGSEPPSAATGTPPPGSGTPLPGTDTQSPSPDANENNRPER